MHKVNTFNVYYLMFSRLGLPVYPVVVIMSTFTINKVINPPIIYINIAKRERGGGINHSHGYEYIHD